MPDECDCDDPPDLEHCESEALAHNQNVDELLSGNGDLGPLQWLALAALVDRGDRSQDKPGPAKPETNPADNRGCGGCLAVVALVFLVGVAIEVIQKLISD